MGTRRGFIAGAVAALAGLMSVRGRADSHEAANIGRPPCDECGAPSYRVVMDLVDETCPGDKWVHFAPTGTRRAGCLDHWPEDRRYAPRDVPRDAPWWTERKPEVLSKLYLHGLIPAPPGLACIRAVRA